MSGIWTGFAPSLRTIQRWVGAIKGGTFTLEKETSLGRPSSTKTPTMIRKVDDLITSDPRLSVRDVAVADSTTVHQRFGYVQYGFHQCYQRGTNQTGLLAEDAF